MMFVGKCYPSLVTQNTGLYYIQQFLVFVELILLHIVAQFFGCLVQQLHSYTHEKSK